jgi:hypothetical protein
MNDKEIQQAVLRELEWEPQVKATEIGVAVKDGNHQQQIAPQ